jgi:cyclophilin family peptidyl-prolyl cis-trans isomerase
MCFTSALNVWPLAALMLVVGCAAMQGGAKATAAEELPQVLLKTSKGDIVIELYEDEAPNTVANFVNLVEKKYYNGVIFHRVIDGFMAQGGDPTGTGRGGPGYAIACECNLPNARKHKAGALSMAHAGKDTGGSQFFLCFDELATSQLNGKHTVFGQVVQGMDVLAKIQRGDRIANGVVPKDQADKIIEATVVKKRNHEYVPKTLPSNR